jgi:putative glutamine amidotransferase
MIPLRIGITKGRNFHFYESWILSVEGTVVIPLHSGNIEEATSCHGIVFSGGEDVHPSHYGKPEYVSKYKLTDFNEERDRFELDLAGLILDTKIPVLGICRGMQLINVYYGGTLVPDLPSFGKAPHSRDELGEDRRHAITIQAGSKLEKISGGLDQGTVNSAHHQSVADLAPGFRTVALSGDDVVESIERTDPSNQYLMLVQWHPERMPDGNNPLSHAILEDFIKAVTHYISEKY